jgi:hypothetical protein
MSHIIVALSDAEDLQPAPQEEASPAAAAAGA